MFPSLILDTNAWLWLFNEPERLSDASRQRLNAESTLGLSDISLWEVGMLQAKGRIILHTPLDVWMRRATQRNLILLLRITPEIAIDSNNLTGEFHGDPADRIITATARSHNLTVVTSDRKILDYPDVQRLSTR
ncbi:MAG TPA: type II toxin-antitoxin system VapC family toxin [Chthoniobacterales bacterium]